MIIKISAMFVLLSTILLFDLRYFFPVAIIILLILNSIEKELQRNDRKRTLASEQESITEE